MSQPQFLDIYPYFLTHEQGSKIKMASRKSARISTWHDQNMGTMNSFKIAIKIAKFMHYYYIGQIFGAIKTCNFSKKKVVIFQKNFWQHYPSGSRG